ncbi:D-beta-hydroxybutyrate dehydrogenase-like [Littorina saxatilis]|uniref:3-oxoacyl-[acyl-carrier-protein] reductase n=1 Tax=Littorina saxatilis TaxID=31220 RepID=A0AAN9AKI0_9CAEN
MRLTSKVFASLAGRLALVTGSTSGIGLGIAGTLASRGCDVILHGFGDDDVIKQAKAKVESHKVRCHWEDADLCDVSSIDKMAESISRVFPKTPDILVNNAGFQSVSDVTQFSLDTWQKMLTVHLTAPFLLTQRLLPAMVDRGWGRIVNIASVHGLVASPYKAAYVSAKHGVIGLTKVVALETAKTGVTCNAVCPGWVETPIFIQQAEARSREQGISYEEARRQMVSNHATEEPVKVQDIGELVSFLCSPAANQMTGSSIVIDGGWTAR